MILNLKTVPSKEWKVGVAARRMPWVEVGGRVTCRSIRKAHPSTVERTFESNTALMIKNSRFWTKVEEKEFLDVSPIMDR